MAKPETHIAKLDTNVTVTVEVHLTRAFRIRLAVARALFWCAAKALGCGIVVTNVTEDQS